MHKVVRRAGELASGGRGLAAYIDDRWRVLGAGRDCVGVAPACVVPDGRWPCVWLHAGPRLWHYRAVALLVVAPVWCGGPVESGVVVLAQDAPALPSGVMVEDGSGCRYLVEDGRALYAATGLSVDVQRLAVEDGPLLVVPRATLHVPTH